MDYTPLKGNDDDDDDEEEEKVSSSCWSWLWPRRKRKKEKEIHRVASRIKVSIKALHNKIEMYNAKIKRMQKTAELYRNERGDEERARSEERQIEHATHVRGIYIGVRDKFCVLLMEIEKAATLGACADHLRDAGVMLEQHINVRDVDDIMSRLELQMEKVTDTERAMTKKKTKKEKKAEEEEEEELPDLPLLLHLPSVKKSDGPVLVRQDNSNNDY